MQTSLIPFKPALATSPAAASETNSFAILTMSGSRTSGGTKLCDACANDAKKDVTLGCLGARNLMK